jgi:hypothetical protein
MMVKRLSSGQRPTETNSIEKIQGKTSKNLGISRNIIEK